MTQRSEQKNEKGEKKYIRAKGKRIQRHALSLSLCIRNVLFSTFIALLSSLQPPGKSVSVFCVYDSSLNLIKRLLT